MQPFDFVESLLACVVSCRYIHNGQKNGKKSAKKLCYHVLQWLKIEILNIFFFSRQAIHKPLQGPILSKEIQKALILAFETNSTVFPKLHFFPILAQYDVTVILHSYTVQATLRTIQELEICTCAKIHTRAFIGIIQCQKSTELCPQQISM